MVFVEIFFIRDGSIDFKCGNSLKIGRWNWMVVCLVWRVLNKVYDFGVYVVLLFM